MNDILFLVVCRFDWLTRRLHKQLLDAQVRDLYARAGLAHAQAIETLSTGAHINLEETREPWAFWEKVYANRGFVTLHDSAFSLAVTHGRLLTDLLDERLEKGRTAVLHAERHRPPTKPTATDAPIDAP